MTHPLILGPKNVDPETIGAKRVEVIDPDPVIELLKRWKPTSPEDARKPWKPVVIDTKGTAREAETP